MFQIVKEALYVCRGLFTFIYTLSMYTDLGLLFSRMGVLLGTRWKRSIPSFDLLPPTHTTHTYTPVFGASFSVALGVVTSADVCVCSCRGRSQTIRRVCSISLRIFDIEF